MREEQRLGAIACWPISWHAVVLATGSWSSAILADQLHQLPFAIDETSSASEAPSNAQHEKDSASQIVITGSRIPRTNLTAVSPVTTVKREEFELRGATNVEEVLNQLPQINPSQGEFFGAGATGTAALDLRGLGPGRTLVMINGHRLMPGDPRYPIADVNSVPTPLIQRVEVLTGGAAAVYGSDAVAGVVNFILDTKLDGFKAESNAGGYQHDNRDKFAQGLLDQAHLPYPKGSVFDGWRESLSLAFGRGFFDDRAHVTLYGGYRRIAAVRLNRRDYGACPITARIINDRPSSIVECGGPLVSYPGNYFDNLGNVYQITSERTFVPGISRFNASAWNLYQRPDRRYTAGGFANLDFSKSVQAYGEVMAMKDRTRWQIGPSGDFRNTQTINCDNPLLSAQQRSLICRTGNFVGEIPELDSHGNLVGVVGSPTLFVAPITGVTYSRAWLILSRREIQGRAVEDDLDHKSIRLLGGVKGVLGRGVSYDASYLFGHVGLDRKYRNNFSITRITRSLDVVSDPLTGQPVCRSALIARRFGASAPGADAACVPWDVFAIGHATPGAAAYLTIPPFMHGSLDQRVANANATIELDRWGLGSPWSEEGSAINLGAEFRKDSVKFDPDKFSQKGDVAGFGDQVFPIRGSIVTKEIFGEVRVPLVTNTVVRRLAFEGAFRKSWYGNPASDFSSTAYKLAVDLTAVTGLRFRASQQRAIRAPNIQELFAPAETDSFGRDPCVGIAPAASQAQCALAGVTAAQYGHVAKVSSTVGYNAIIGGNENLEPESALTRTIEIVIEPRLVRGFNATIDLWDIRLKGAVSRIGAQAIIDSCIASGDPIFCSRIHRDPNGSLALGTGYVDNRQANLGGRRVRGIDVGANYLVPLGRAGSASFDFRGGYVLKGITDNGGLSTPYDCAGLFGGPCGIQPRWKHTARATWEAPHDTSLSLQWRHIGGVKLAALDPSFNRTDEVSAGHSMLRAQDYLDVTAARRIGNRFEFRLGVNNLLDRQPPLVVGNTAAGDGPFNNNTYPEWYDVLGRYIFASATVSFKP